MKEYKIVVLENTYDLIQESKEARDFLSKIFKVKLDGYRPYYDYGILPLGETDFWGNHVALCVVEDGELNPVMAYKSVTTNDAKRMGKKFPLYEHVLMGEHCKEHYLQSKNWVDSLVKRGENVGYNHSWTICPHYKKDVEIRRTAMELTKALMYRYYYDYNIPNMILACSKTFKVFKVMDFVGFDYLSNKDGKMPAFAPTDFKGEEFYIMHLEGMNHSIESKMMYEKYKGLWENRITLRPSIAIPKAA